MLSSGPDDGHLDPSNHFGTYSYDVSKRCKAEASYRRGVYLCDKDTCKSLGTGAYGIVYSGVMRGEGKVAIKRMDGVFEREGQGGPPRDYTSAVRAYREMHILRQLCHPFRELKVNDVVETDVSVAPPSVWVKCKVQTINPDDTVDVLILQSGDNKSRVSQARVRVPRCPYVVHLKVSTHIIYNVLW